MDFEKEATRALEARARLWEQRKGVTDDAGLSDAEKRERVERIDTEMREHEQRAAELVEQGEREAEIRSITERAGALGTKRQRSRGEQRTEGPDLERIFREIGTGERRNGFDVTATTAIEQRANANTDASAATTDDAANAGDTVSNTFVREVLESLRDSSPLLSLVRIVSTATGEPMAWPRKTGRPTAGKVQEGAAYPKSGGSFNRFNLGAHKYGVISEASVEMLTDSALALASIIAADIGEAVGEDVTADVLSNADGATGPEGLLTVVTAGNELTDGTALTSDDLIDLQHAIIEKYRRRAVFLMSDDTAVLVRKLKNAVDGNYLWQPSLIAGQPDTLLGKPVYTDPNMPAFTGSSGAKGILFGDFSKYVLRQVRTVTVSRSDEYGWDSDMVAFKGTWRGDGGLHDLQAIAALSEDAV